MKKLIALLAFIAFTAHAEVNSVVFNVTSDSVVSGSLKNTEMSIASISKLMTVYTVLDQQQDLSEVLYVESKLHNHTKLHIGMSLTRKELIDLALVSSDNLAALTLAENFPGGKSYFVAKMNSNAIKLDMMNSRFVEPTGLSPMNISTLEDISKLTREVSQFDQIKTAASSTNTTVTIQTKSKSKNITSNSTSKYFGKEGIVAIKTGFTKAAGYCITILVRSNEQLYNIVVLGAKSPAERQRIVESSMKIIKSS
jgi:serine-type D-Ala-D-Ala endopeptidase (penicillin-binding protein 7)